MSEEPWQNLGRGLVDRKLVEAPPPVISTLAVPRRHFCFVSSLLFFFFSIARFIAVVSVLHVILAMWPPVLQSSCPLCLFVCVLFVLFLLFVVGCFGEPKQNQGRGLVGHKLVQASPSPVMFIAGRPKAALMFWFFGDFRCGALLFMVIHVIYKYKNR